MMLWSIHHQGHKAGLGVLMLTLCAGILSSALVAPAAADVSRPSFPSVKTTDLNGRGLTLPADLPGDPTLVLVAFFQRQQSDINAWIDGLDLKNENAPAWVELPVVGRGWKAMKPFVNGGMRSGIPDAKDRARTITLFYGRKRFLDALDLREGTDQVYAMVVEPSGTVRTVVRGMPTPETEAVIRRAMAASSPTQGNTP